MLKTIAGVAAGIVAAVAAILLVQFVGHAVYPAGEVDFRDREAVSAMIRSLPVGALLFVAAAWFTGALAGGAVAAWISGRRWTAWLVGAVVALMAVVNIFTYPHPAWMQIAAIVAPALGGIVAGHLAGRRPRPAGERL
ncbi:MAG: hypothetical protein ACK40O_02095 [Allosphingosinicella sp.]